VCIEIREYLQTFTSKNILLLGFSIVRESLSVKQIGSVTLFTTVFLFMGVLSSFLDRNPRDLKSNNADLTAMYILFEMVFVSWIYLEFGSMMELLEKTGQNFKYNIYMRLGQVLMVSMMLLIFLQVLVGKESSHEN